MNALLFFLLEYLKIRKLADTAALHPVVRCGRRCVDVPSVLSWAALYVHGDYTHEQKVTSVETG
jgi:hypothetical protein